MKVRFLAATGSEALRARYAQTLSATAAAALASVAEARVFALDAALEPSLQAALEGCGAVVASVAGETLVAASRRTLERAANDVRVAQSPTLQALVTALGRAAAPACALRLRDRRLDLRDQAQVMGIINVTPDSFYERVEGPAAARSSARAMAAAGAAVVDIGGQSYAHWNARVAPDEEAARVVPAVAAIVADGIDVALSVDTFTASVADAALRAGAHLINDCTGLSDPELAHTVAAHRAALVVMHLKGTLNRRDPDAYVYRDVLAEIVDFLFERTERALAAGVARDAILIDPGLEFGKEPATDLEILERFGELRALGYPILFASSRKSFIGRIFNRPAAELLVPSLATAAVGIAGGARLLRVHDVPETVQLARMLGAATARGRAALEVAGAMPGTPGGNSPEA